MSKRKQLVIIGVATIAMIATVNHLLCSGDRMEPVTLIPEPIVIETPEPIVDVEPIVDIQEVDLVATYSELIAAENLKVDFTKSMYLNDMYIELLTGAMAFDNMTGDYHVSLITDAYTADMWNNVDTCKGYVSLSSTVSDASTDWVKVTDEQSELISKIFYSVTYEDLLGIINSVFNEVECYDKEYITSELNWKLRSNCHSGVTTITRNGDTLTIIIDNPNGTDTTKYVMSMSEVHASAPDICTKKTSTLCELNNVWSNL